MGKQDGHGDARGGIGQCSLVDAVVARFMVLQAEMRDVFAERQEKVIIAIMMRTEERVGLGDELSIVSLGFGSHLQCGRAIGGDIDLMARSLAGSEIDHAKVASRNHG